MEKKKKPTTKVIHTVEDYILRYTRYETKGPGSCFVVHRDTVQREATPEEAEMCKEPGRMMLNTQEWSWGGV
jgi:uncharacterized protein YutD